jgi:pyruvate/2-oxoglutarate dehydrogenase complex dihydrolipoamide dehydrogenase (E3) component
MRRAPEFGLAPVEVAVNFPEVMERVQQKIAMIEPHDSVERFTSLGVDCVAGDARIVSPWEVEVNGERISTRHIVIASGARARVPDIPGLETLDYLTSDTLWDIRELTRSAAGARVPARSAASWPRPWRARRRGDPGDPRGAHHAARG